MKREWTQRVVCGAMISLTAWALGAQAPLTRGPVQLRVDNLKTPLGIDDRAPRFSWQLKDSARGAKQSAYEVMVVSKASTFSSAKPDVWDSGRIASDQSMNVSYQGPALKPSTRYFWRVKVWDAAGKVYPESATGWWETGLLNQNAWHGSWIGYETPEEAAVRHAPAQWIANPDFKTLAVEKTPEQRFAYRSAVKLDKAVRHAALFAACEDTVSAWVNGSEVLKADPLPPYKQMPWKKYVRVDVAKQLVQGTNEVALECLHYNVNPNGMAGGDAPPLNATLYVEYDDGGTATFASDTEWKTAIHATDGWQQNGFDDSTWKNAETWKRQAPGPQDEPLGHPWIPDSVKALRNSFTVSAPVKSARLYATSLGAYEMFLNGKRVSEDVLAPGWTDYRLRLMYQTYDVTAMVASGKNAIAALLAPGWYATPLEWFQQPNNYGDTPPALRAQLRIEHTDGSVEWVTTSADWQANTSNILHSEIYDGESQDARLEQPGWASAQFTTSGKISPVLNAFDCKARRERMCGCALLKL